jgi:Condensation domain
VMKQTSENNYSCAVAAVSRLCLPRRAPSEPVPLSFQQEFAWKHFMHPEIPFIVYDARRLRGPLNFDILCKSLGLVIERHEALRTRIVTVNGVPKQRVDEPREFQLKLLSFPEIPSSDIQAQAQRVLRSFFWKWIDLEEGPLFDVRLLKIGEQDHVLAVVLHHLITDAVSFNLLLRETWIAYGAFSRGQEPDLPAVSMQYADYAIWQRSERHRWLQKHEEYWSRRLANATGAVLPKDAGLEHVSPYELSVVDAPFEQDLSAALHELSQRQRTTTATILLALFAVLLSRWSARRDFVLPYVVSGRLGSMDRTVVGYIGQFLLLRIELGGDESFVDMVKLVTREFCAAYEHLDFGTITSERPELLRGASLNGLISSLDAFSETQLDRGGEAVAVEPFPLETVFPEKSRLPSDTYCLFWSTTAGIQARCIYRADLFKARTVECFLEDLRIFARQIVRNPTARVASLRRWNEERTP